MRNDHCSFQVKDNRGVGVFTTFYYLSLKSFGIVYSVKMWKELAYILQGRVITSSVHIRQVASKYFGRFKLIKNVLC